MRQTREKTVVLKPNKEFTKNRLNFKGQKSFKLLRSERNEKSAIVPANNEQLKLL